LSEHEFHQIYLNTVSEITDKKYALDLYRFWYSLKIYTPPLLKLHDYLIPHNPDQTMREYLSRKLCNHHTIESFDPAITIDDSGVSYNPSVINYYGEIVFHDLPEFKKRLMEHGYGLIDENFPFSGREVVLAGGAVHKCLEKRIKLEDVQDYCDIDIYICSPDEKILKREKNKVVNYFQKKLGKDIYWIRKRPNVLTLLVPGYNRAIQISMFRNNIEKIISKFDFSHVQYLYDGHQILTTLPGIEYATHLVTIHSGNYDIYYPKRFYKAKQLNLCMLLPTADCLSLNIPREIKIDSWFPTYSDDLELVQQQIRSIYGVKRDYITKSKPCRIYCGKFPTEYRNDRLSIDHAIIGDDGASSLLDFSDSNGGT